MILVADSGSTKCDWLYFDKNEAHDKVTTMGFNPFFHNSGLITDEILRSEALNAIKENIHHVYYFGAGCSSKARKAVIHEALKTVFPNAHTLVEHDLLGAAYAACGNTPGIACILGTGSNSCYFDGSETYEEVPALGYILGDEGSGSSMGRKLLARYLYKQLPDYLQDKFHNDLKLTRETIFEAVYNRPNANVYMASFMREVGAFGDRPWVRDFIAENLREFLNIHVCCYNNYRKVPVNAVGSIAYYFETILRTEAEKLGISIGAVKKKPVFALKDYFYQKHYGASHS